MRQNIRPPTPSIIRSRFSDQVKDRDRHVCVFSGISDPQAAYIFPFITSEKKNFTNLNHLLTTFWGSEKAMAWRRDFKAAGITQSVLKPNVYIRSDMDVLLQAGVTDQRWGYTLAHRKSGVRIQTGQTFILQRHEHMPSWELLEMQWDLLRVAALCGAADVMDDYYDSEDPDERGYDATVFAKQDAIQAEYEKTKTKAEVVDRTKGKGRDLGEWLTSGP
ncbi:hypothetical protein B0T16DRAFT_424804 [Cercophora newfieldiana]|uniref:HNH nuclease domain-containing protein n=1 Tax=Cercophora newfieldiana TaxID=92897 RepID=A0AA39YQQ9_9PEZI|nr:hypothetical protein B0T16DRAFT_424804 [Cercophora newfieldiana]